MLRGLLLFSPFFRFFRLQTFSSFRGDPGDSHLLTARASPGKGARGNRGSHLHISQFCVTWQGGVRSTPYRLPAVAAAVGIRIRKAGVGVVGPARCWGTSEDARPTNPRNSPNRHPVANERTLKTSSSVNDSMSDFGTVITAIASPRALRTSKE